MKKTYCIFLIVICLLTGCAVDPPTYHFDASDLKEKATKIVLVECENDNPEWIEIDEDTFPSFDVASVKLVKELPEDKMENFIDGLSTITFHIENESVNSPIGYAVLIYTSEQNVIVLSSTTLSNRAYSIAATFTIEGNFVNLIARFADRSSFTRLVEECFECGIFE